ncbi:MAG: IS1595 family transposase [Acholeplasmataceae bacterium]|nr:IS1595 family transposase [Acholeplasmataceae bacterium]
MNSNPQIQEINHLIQSLCADDYNTLLNQMSKDEKVINQAADALHRIIFRERGINQDVVKHGRTSRGRQRYLDKTTGRTLSDTDCSIVKRTKKTYKQWEQYIRFMLYGLSLRKIAKELGISVTTAFAWRHKVIEAIKDYQEDDLLSGEIEMDETYFLLNMKGSWKHKHMPRKAKKGGAPSVYRGISNEQVCVLIAIDEHDRILSKVIGQGHPTKNEIWHACQGRIKPNSHVTTDSQASYVEVCKQLKCSIVQIPSGKQTIDGYSLGVVNNYHSELKTWMRRFRGVSTKHLDGYLAWFRFMKYLTYQMESNIHAGHTLKYSVSNHVSMTISDIHNRPFPVDIFKPYQHLS